MCSNRKLYSAATSGTNGTGFCRRPGLCHVAGGGSPTAVSLARVARDKALEEFDRRYPVVAFGDWQKTQPVSPFGKKDPKKIAADIADSITIHQEEMMTI